MKWIPPRSLPDRATWVDEHPAIAGCYFGFILAVILTIWGTIRTGSSIALGLAIGIPTWLFAWALFPVLVKRRFGERPDRERYPAATLRRPWSRASNRFLFWAMMFSILVGLVSVSEIFARDDLLDAAFGLLASIWIGSQTLAERRRRRTSW